MSQTVKVEGVGAITFPDDATPDEIQQTLNRDYPPKSSALGAAGRGFLGGVFPTAAAVGAGALTAAGLEAAGAPETLGTSLLLIPPTLAAGYLAGKLQQKAIHKVAPQVEAQQQQDIQQHPIASTVGELASGLPVMRLSPGAVFRNPAQAAIAAGVGAAAGVAQPLLEGQKPTLRDVATSAAFPLLYGKPRFGGKPTPQKVVEEAAPILPRAAQAATEAIAEKPKPTEVPSAIEEGKVQESSQPEHTGTAPLGVSTETSGGNRPEPVAAVPEEGQARVLLKPEEVSELPKYKGQQIKVGDTLEVVAGNMGLKATVTVRAVNPDGTIHVSGKTNSGVVFDDQWYPASKSNILRASSVAEPKRVSRSRVEKDTFTSAATEPPTTPEPPATEQVAPVAAVEAKTQSEVTKTAVTEGKRSAQEIKSELVQRLTEAANKAPDLNIQHYTQEQLEKIGKVTFDIPGDGTFTVWNTKSNLENLRDRAKKISTNPNEPIRAKRTGISKEDKAWVEQQMAKQPPPPTPGAGPGTGLGPGAKTVGEPEYPAISQLTDRLKATPPTGAEQTLSTRDKVTEAWANGKTLSQRALGLARSLSESIKDTVRGVRNVTDIDRAYGVFDRDTQLSSGRSVDAGKAMKRQVKNKTDREATALWIDTPGDAATKQATLREALGNLPAGTRPSVRAAIARAANMPPELVQFAEDLRQFFGLRENDAIAHEIFEHGLEDYFTHVWKKEGNMPDSVRAAISSGRVNDYFKFARQRKIGMFLEGIMQGKTPALDPADIVPLYNFSMDRSIASRQLVRGLSDLEMSDGRPMLLPTGTAVPVERGGTPQGLIIDPKNKGHLGADYRVVDHPALRKWKWAGTDANGNPVLYRSDLAVHPEAYERVARLMDRGRLTPTTWGRRALRLSTEVKGFKLGLLSAFHQVHVGSHALFHWTSPFSFKDPELFHPEGGINWDSPAVSHAIEKGHLKVAPDPHELVAFGEGLLPTGLVTKIPFLGQWSKAYSDYVFTRLIPSLKLKTYKNALARANWLHENTGAFKGLGPDEIAARTGDSVNNAFGELNQLFLGKVGRDPRFQRLLRGIFLAPDFGEARLRFAEKAFTKFGHEERLALATMFMTMYLGARVANKLTHDDAEWDMKHAFEVKADNHWWSMRSVLGDLNHAVNNFGQFMYVRLNPLYARTASDWLLQRDPQGRKLTFTEKAFSRPLQQLVPIQFGGLTRDDQKLWESFVTAAGVQTRRDRPAQDVGQLAREWMKASKDPKLEEKVAALEQEVFPKSKYAKLRYALQDNNVQAAKDALTELRKTHKPADIRKAMEPRKPFTGSWATEAKFKRSLTPAQLKLYNQAMQDRMELYRRYNRLLTP